MWFPTGGRWVDTVYHQETSVRGVDAFQFRVSNEDFDLTLENSEFFYGNLPVAGTANVCLSTCLYAIVVFCVCLFVILSLFCMSLCLLILLTVCHPQISQFKLYAPIFASNVHFIGYRDVLRQYPIAVSVSA